ncbi:dermonecrotic toxin SpeSicTox-betaIB1b-like [Daphnia pulex]|uniref:dermonecrotic toxin SpeSicTox-betaIB1b-like n=1 Tax=Daphnia pulex TaxID=6669 RepID=UPI001EE13055|nr:dermonecrotic toxin SpeSicTox-betaIB1b-like [Daphnia pulex]XP_046464555.1 dermonecrotic toxin SpeSicTox-betaIB1b-like [Daphnia pulex]XP_046464556.1 dermonecrotic toxin SpeSicTox-betaIB1b-like [Daphnia pulex]XP_046464557.1 dermonecrotic toxin SpeSicTox-betaIB1b-like [Daphnia pulex]XP_046464558.1 dermonecrotic toxin SpeSicTox-betaIB1b-like [Daphnia pulex]
MNRVLSFFVSVLIVIPAVIGYGNGMASPKVSVIAHMINTPNAVRWALNQGANGIEIDLKFEGTRPSVFYHGFPCDCTCLLQFLTNRHNRCGALGEGCSASTNVTEMTNFLGSSEIISSKLALIYIDAKLDKSVRNYAEAGANVVRLFNEQVLARGFRGQILLGCLTILYSDYLRGALREAARSNYTDRYFYTIDNEGDHAFKVLDDSLQLGTNNLVYATGITACLPVTFHDAIQYSLEKKTYAAVGIWTIDQEYSMRSYLDICVDFILTNRPKRAAELIGLDNIPLPGSALKAKSRDRVMISYAPFWECDCSYFYRFIGGGCAITKMAPPNHACECFYVGAWSCSGQTIKCPDLNDRFCQSPDTSEASCLFGGGDCNGYF